MVLERKHVIFMAVGLLAALTADTVYANDPQGAWGGATEEAKPTIKTDSVAAEPGVDTVKPKPSRARAKRVKQESPQRSAVRPTHEMPPVTESPEPVEVRLSKNWGGARTKLSNLGVDIAMIYKGEYHETLRGGLNQKSELLGNFDLRVSLDAEKLVGWNGGSAFIYVLGNHGGAPSLNVGDTQSSSNIETPGSNFRLYELWVQQLFFEDRMSILLGLHDLNSEFYGTDTSTLFFNSSFGVGKELAQTGKHGPSIFPFTSPALRLRAEPSKSFYVEGAMFNAVAGDPTKINGTHPQFGGSDGQLMIFEAAYQRGKLDTSERAGKYAFGTWAYTHTFDDQIATYSGGEPVQDVSHGAYILADQTVADGVSMFVRYGVASPGPNRIKSCLSGGIVFTGLLPGRASDRFGIAATRAENSSQYMELQTAAGEAVTKDETVLELNYRFEAIRGVAIQPSFQRVFHPNTLSSTPDASIMSARLELNL